MGSHYSKKKESDLSPELLEYIKKTLSSLDDTKNFNELSFYIACYYLAFENCSKEFVLSVQKKIREYPSKTLWAGSLETLYEFKDYEYESNKSVLLALYNKGRYDTLDRFKFVNNDTYITIKTGVKLLKENYPHDLDNKSELKSK